MPQEVQMLAFCFISVALSLFVTLVCLNEKASLLAFDAKIQTPITIRRVNISIQLLGLQVAL
ncbi:hypothetical protein NQZ68_004362 [Dissostichus eleginoides]|nr:hypothetical protein NQZ68_004362 [Dissostichus eleginoides]